FHAAGGLAFMIGELLDAGLLHADVRTVAGPGLARYTQEPKLGADGEAVWGEGPGESLNTDILRPARDPFQATGGLKRLTGNLGTAVIKVSAVREEHQVVEAPARVFADQGDVMAAFKAGELERDCVVVVRFQGPRANGMPELHSLTPPLSVLQKKGFKVALVTDGRMSGASGKVPAAIHLSPEGEEGGPIAKLRDGDIVRLDAVAGVVEALVPEAEWAARETVVPDLAANQTGIGREMFRAFRERVGSADAGAAVVV
ncbi:MAG: dihydroxy-acid dehydratase, partial [Rhodobiaceae bacterium]|nr:dihydroxy-acid dehydratase [Rhodobiaceae bacterium]